MFAISLAVSNAILLYNKLIGNNHLWYIRSFLYISPSFFFTAALGFQLWLESFTMIRYLGIY